MRLRPITALSAVAAATLLLAGCGASETPEAEETAPVATDLCSVGAETGPASESVTVEGEFGTASTAAFELGQTVEDIQRTVLEEGDGAELESGEWVSYALSAFDAETGERIGDAGYVDGELMPAQLTAESSLGQILGCAPVGSRLSVVFPGSEEAAAQFYIVDVLETVPTAAWGETTDWDLAGVDLDLDDDGTPNITVPEGDAPAETQVATVKKGDGYEVQSGDYVLIQFRGARWSTGELFDGGDTWASGTPYTGATTGFVPGFSKALEGQTVGSQVLVAMTPEDGYGAGEINEDDLVGETLVFVIDILGAQSAG